jgi:hypothetical protein
MRLSGERAGPVLDLLIGASLLAHFEILIAQAGSVTRVSIAVL